MLPLIFFYGAQAVMIIYALCMAFFQTAILKGMIAHWPVRSPYNKPFHRFGWAIAAIVGLLCVPYQQGYLNMILCLLLMIGWYSLVFDCAIGKRVYKNTWYLGTSAWHDRLFKTGKRKAIIIAILIVLINAIPFIIPLL